MSWPVFYLNRIPVFSSPWLMIPVKRERQSGLLFPRFGFSKKEGFKIRPAVIIVPSDRTELYLEGLVASRWGIGGEGRAAYSAGGAHGWLAVTYLDELLKTVYPAFSLGSWLDPAAAITDRSATSAVTTPGTRAQRWTLSTFQEARLSRWGRLRLNSTLISDTRIYSDFAESLDSLTTDRVATTVEAVALAPRGGGALDMAVVSAVRTIDTTNLHRIPRLSFSWFPELIPGLGGYISGSLENDFVRARTAEFPLAPTAFVRQGLSGRTAMEISGRWRPTPGITLSLTGGPEGFLHIPDGHYQDLLLQGEFAAASIPTLTAQHAAAASNTTVAVRPRALLDTEVLLVRRYRHGVHQIGPFLEAAVEKLYGNLPDLVVWLNEEDGGYLGGKVGVRSYFQGLNWYHGIEMYYTAVATGTDLFGSDSWPLPTAWHARGWGGGGPLTVWAHVAGLRGAPERLDASLLYQPYILGGQWAFELGYSQITHGYRWDSPLWYNPAGGGRLYFSDDRIAEDLTGRMVARIIPELGLSFTYRYSLTRSELVYWRAGTNLSSSCQCWQVQLGYSRLIAPGTDRFEFAFQMVGLGGASLE